MKALDAVEDLRRLRALAEAGGRLNVAADALGLKTPTLRNWLRRVGLASRTNTLRGLMARRLIAEMEQDALEVAA